MAEYNLSQLVSSKFNLDSLPTPTHSESENSSIGETKDFICIEQLKDKENPSYLDCPISNIICHITNPVDGLTENDKITLTRFNDDQQSVYDTITKIRSILLNKRQTVKTHYDFTRRTMYNQKCDLEFRYTHYLSHLGINKLLIQKSNLSVLPTFTSMEKPTFWLSESCNNLEHSAHQAKSDQRTRMVEDDGAEHDIEVYNLANPFNPLHKPNHTDAELNKSSIIKKSDFLPDQYIMDLYSKGNKKDDEYFDRSLLI
ncbi:uncharacterized protein L201_007470 [Kwoniella dendrophila CBS 6074]|uniref:Uncharacterized protein n=1 Tax=Kwoniella dendrophila CBS 6074 TaxID=1295534 RepID=A0AAX4K4H0_9TREE